MEEWGDKVPEGDRDDLRKLNDELKEALKGYDIARIRSATDALMQKFQSAGQSVYQQEQATQASQAEPQAAAGGGGGATPPPADSGDGDVVEGEIVDEGE